MNILTWWISTYEWERLLSVKLCVCVCVFRAQSNGKLNSWKWEIHLSDATSTKKKLWQSLRPIYFIIVHCMCLFIIITKILEIQIADCRWNKDATKTAFRSIIPSIKLESTAVNVSVFMIHRPAAIMFQIFLVTTKIELYECVLCIMFCIKSFLMALKMSAEKLVVFS